jgi:hypothetical protein
MEAVSVVSFGHNRLEFLKRRIIEAHIRIVKGGSEWVEGSLEIAAALREGRDAVPADISFNGWLKQNNLVYYNHNDRAALINLAADIELARTVLTETDKRSYQHIWAENKARFTHLSKPHSDQPQTNRKRRVRNPGRAQLFRTMKLGEEIMNKIKGTSLDSSVEMDELVILNRGATEGRHTEVVLRLVEAAAKGEPVSAIAEGVAMSGVRRSSAAPQLMTAWKRRMIAPWKLANVGERIELLFLLAKELDHGQQDSLCEKIMDSQRGG